METLIIFDFDGVVADSEMIANAALAEIVTELGSPISLEETMASFMGKRLTDVMAAIHERTGREPSADLPTVLEQRTFARFRSELKEMTGVRAFLAAFPGVKRCVASSSSPERVHFCLQLLKLEEAFGAHVFSAAGMARGKPHPDIFLHAAARMKVAPTGCLVIEDSASGVAGAVAAGMTVIGFLGGAHIRDGHGERLTAFGAHHLAWSFAEVERIARSFLAKA